MTTHNILRVISPHRQVKALVDSREQLKSNYCVHYCNSKRYTNINSQTRCIGFVHTTYTDKRSWMRLITFVVLLGGEGGWSPPGNVRLRVHV